MGSLPAYNAPTSDDDLVASFNDLPSAQAYAEEYGGEVTPVGVAFAVGRGADHARARSDFAALLRTQDVQPAQPSGYTNDDIDRIVAERVAASLAERDAASQDGEDAERDGTTA